MQIAIFYVSRGEKTQQNTKQAAELLAQQLGATASPIDENSTITNKIDFLFVGSGTYNNKADEKVINFLNTIDQKYVGQVVPFATAGGSGGALKQIKKLSQQRQMQVAKKGLLIRMFRHTTMTDNRKNKIIKFCTKFCTKFKITNNLT